MKTVALLLLASSVALADPRPHMTREAQAHFDRGRDLYKHRDYSSAIAEFERGRDLDPNPDFDYALGQVYSKLGDCKHAIREYNAFLSTQLSEDEITHARKSMAMCTKSGSGEAVELEHAAAVEQPSARPDPSEPTDTTAPAPPPPPVHHAHAHVARLAAPHLTADTGRSDAPSWYSDVPGDLLAGAGVAGLAAGVAFLELADRDVAAASSATTVAKLQALSAQADHERTLGLVGLTAGGVLAVGAIVRYAVVAHGHRAADPVVSVNLNSTGAVAVWSGRF